MVAAIRDAIGAVDGVNILDSSSDASHNRSVITFVVPIERAVEAAFAGISEAASRIDLRQHTGEHPRIGATDVVPFVPLEDSTMEDCIALARARRTRRNRAEDSGLFVRASGHSTNASESRRCATRSVRRVEHRARNESRARSRFRSKRNSSIGRRNCNRRAPIPRRLQRLPRRRSEPSAREEHRERSARILRRIQARQGTWTRSRWSGASLDESRRH